MFTRAVSVALLLGALLAVLPSHVLLAEENQSSAKEIMAQFDKGDPGWKVRMEALVRLARMGPPAVPDLVAALQKGSPTTREFAAQALTLFADPRSKAALDQAVSDNKAGVRIHALLALSMFGPLPETEVYHKLRASDPSRFGVPPIVSAGLSLKEKLNAEELRDTLAKFDLAAMDSARLGEVAPDFTLADYAGKSHRFSDYRGRQMVVLRFLLYDH